MKDGNLPLAELDSAHLIHPITEFAAHERHGPRVITGGEGIRLQTADGRRVIDGFSGLFNINIGHGRTEIAVAVSRQMRELAYYPSFWGFSSEPAIRLATRLAELMPEGCEIDHFLLTTGGSDANESAFRTARLYHAVRGDDKRVKILSRRWAYHGITRGAGSATTIPVYHIFAEPDRQHLPVAASYCFRCEFDRSLPECGYACVDSVEETIRREGADTVAALILEPVAGTGGIIPPPPEYMNRVAEVCHAHGVLLIFDEVITGFGRTGKWFGMEHWDARPDLIAFAKGVTSGYLPLGGIGISRQVYETIRDRSPKGLPYMMGLTYNNHPTSCAAALANIDIIERERLVDNSKEVGAYLIESLRQALGDYPRVADIRGIGMLASVELAEPGTRDPVGGRAMAYPAAVANACWEQGLIIRALWENIALAPPLCTTRADVDEIVEIIVRAMKSAAS